MKRALILPALLLLAWVPPAAHAAAPASSTTPGPRVTATGEAPLGDGPVQTAEEAARADGARKALETVLLPYLGPQPDAAALARLRELIRTRAPEFVTLTRPTAREEAGGTLRLTAEYTVSLMPALALLQKEGLLPTRRVAVIFTEEHFGRPVTDGVAETTLTAQLIRAGFQVIDREEIARARTKATSEPDAIGLALVTARAARADVLVLGHVLAEKTSPVQGIATATARVSLRVIDTDRGNTLAADASMGNGAALTPDIAAKTASEKILRTIAPRVIETILAAPLPATRRISLTVGPFATLALLGDFQRELAAVPGIRSVNRRSYSQGTALLDVEVDRGAAERLAETLEASDALRRRGGRVVEADPWQIRVTVAQTPPGVPQ